MDQLEVILLKGLEVICPTLKANRWFPFGSPLFQGSKWLRGFFDLAQNQLASSRLVCVSQLANRQRTKRKHVQMHVQQDLGIHLAQVKESPDTLGPSL